MTPDERERLARLVAEELRGILRASDATVGDPPWLPIPVRPEPPAPGGRLPEWAGASQSLGDLAPIRHPTPSAHRDDAGAAAASVRAAAAGKGPGRRGGRGESGAGPAAGANRVRRAPVGVEVPIGISRRHVHLSAADAVTLFGSATLEVHRVIRQPGQFAARQRLTLVGPGGRLEDVRVVGPARGETQVEVARTDAARLAIDPPVAASGALDGSLGGLTLVGPAGRVALARGVIVAARHVHIAPDDAARWGLRDGDRVDMRCGVGARAVTWHDVLVRSGNAHATEFHLDEDEAHAAAVANGTLARIVARHEGSSARRPLITERDVVALVQRGAPIPANAILTPGARDRARALGLEPT